MTLQHTFRFLAKVVVAAVALVLVSCESILDTRNVNAIPADQITINESRIRSLLIGVYDAFSSGQLTGGRIHNYSDIRGGDFENRTFNPVTNLQTYQNLMNQFNPELVNCWTSAYVVINRANEVIERIAQNPTVVSATNATAWTAEARFLRGMMYLYLVNLYARPYPTDSLALGVPLRLRFENFTQNNDLARSTVAQVYAQIFADLNFAVTNLPATYTSPIDRVTRAHQNTARAAMMRMFLYTGNFTQAQAFADAMISGTFPAYITPAGAPHSLGANILVPFTAPWTSSENIFAVAFGPNDLPGVQNALASYYAPPTLILGDYYIDLTTSPAPFNSGMWQLATAGTVDPTDGLPAGAGAWLSTDLRKAGRLAAGGWTEVSGSPARTYLVKWNQNPAIDYVQIFRYPEVLLTAAETRCRLNPAATLGSGAGALALQYYNAVRRRANASTDLVAADFGDNTDNLLRAIMYQRRIEFLGEGHRYYDLRRTGQGLPAKEFQGFGVTALPYTANNYIWPIPQVEIDNNRLCVQNPGF